MWKVRPLERQGRAAAGAARSAGASSWWSTTSSSMPRGATSPPLPLPSSYSSPYQHPSSSSVARSAFLYPIPGASMFFCLCICMTLLSSSINEASSLFGGGGGEGGWHQRRSLRFVSLESFRSLSCGLNPPNTRVVFRWSIACSCGAVLWCLRSEGKHRHQRVFFIVLVETQCIW